MQQERAGGVEMTGRERQRAETTTRLMAATESLLFEGVSFAELSVEQVILRAKVARSTFYSRFDDLGHLLRSLGENVVSDIIEAARPWMDLGVDVSRDKLAAVLTELVMTYLQREKLLAALSEASTSDPVVRGEFHRLLASGHVELAKHIVRGQEVGAVRRDVDAVPAAGWLVWMLERGLYQQIRVADPAELDRQIQALVGIVWNTLYAKG